MKRSRAVLTSLIITLVVANIVGMSAGTVLEGQSEAGILQKIPFFRKKSSPVRQTTVPAPKKAEDPYAVESLIADLKDQDPEVRENAAEALGKLKDARAVEPLIIALQDEDSDVRENAAEALGKIRNPSAVVPLIKALKDENHEVREEAAESLGNIRDFQAVEPLIAALRDTESEEVRDDAARALRKITGKNFGLDPVKWKKWWEKGKKTTFFYLKDTLPSRVFVVHSPHRT